MKSLWLRNIYRPFGEMPEKSDTPKNDNGVSLFSVFV